MRIRGPNPFEQSLALEHIVPRTEHKPKREIDLLQIVPGVLGMK
jgi:hypothetical protein